MADSIIGADFFLRSFLSVKRSKKTKSFKFKQLLNFLFILNGIIFAFCMLHFRCSSAAKIQLNNFFFFEKIGFKFWPGTLLLKHFFPVDEKSGKILVLDLNHRNSHSIFICHSYLFICLESLLMLNEQQFYLFGHIQRYLNYKVGYSRVWANTGITWKTGFSPWKTGFSHQVT